MYGRAGRLTDKNGGVRAGQVHRAESNRTSGGSARRRRAVGCSYFGARDREEYERINLNMHRKQPDAPDASDGQQPTADVTQG